MRRGLPCLRALSVEGVDDERGVTTIEYTMVLGFMSVISIFAALSLINVLTNMVAVLAIKIAVFLTGFPGS